ncbi:MAG TPA: VWA domain-containing protein [bacterium]|nr:VWA domain-containing protein [bacterium]
MERIFRLLTLFIVLAVFTACSDLRQTEDIHSGEEHYTDYPTNGTSDNSTLVPDSTTNDNASYSDTDAGVKADAELPDENAADDQGPDADTASTENPFVDTAEQPVSTFSIDVDTASYSLVRRYITEMNMMPPVEYVRIEEMINYFSYDYPEAPEGDPFSATIEMAPSPWNEGTDIIMIGLKGKTLKPGMVPLSNLVFLLDVSGSMSSDDKLPLLQKAFVLLVDHLKDTDRVAIVTYAGAAGVALESTPGSEKEKIKNAINSLTSGGSTAGAQGIITAYEIAAQNFIEGGNNRVILATDGDFNVGVSSDEAMEELITEKRESDIFLTTLGFGVGNLQDSKLEILADKGNGNYFYIDNLNEAKKVFVKDLVGNLFTIAKDVKIQVEFNPEKIEKYRLIGYENRVMANEDFEDDTKDAGEIGAGHAVTAYYEVYRTPQKFMNRYIGNDDDTLLSDEEPTTDDTAVSDDDFAPVDFGDDELMQLRLRYKEPTEDTSTYMEKMLTEMNYDLIMSENMGFSSAVVEFAMIVRRSQYKEESSYDRVLDRAAKHIGLDAWGFRGEFLEIVEKAKQIDQ